MLLDEEFICEKVRELRASTGLNQRDFSLKLGVSYPSVQRYERTRAPRGSVLARIIGLSRQLSRPDLAIIFEDFMRSEVGRIVGSSDPQIDVQVARGLSTLPARDKTLISEVIDMIQDQNGSYRASVADMVQAWKSGSKPKATERAVSAIKNVRSGKVQHG